MIYRSLLLFIAWTLLVFFIGGYAHEGDIQRNCKDHGKTNSAGWRGEMTCSPVLEKAN